MSFLLPVPSAPPVGPCSRRAPRCTVAACRRRGVPRWRRRHARPELTPPWSLADVEPMSHYREPCGSPTRYKNAVLPHLQEKTG